MYLGFLADVSMYILITLINSIRTFLAYWLKCTGNCQSRVEVNLGFKGKTGLPFVAEGEANGAVKVSATWKRQQEA